MTKKLLLLLLLIPCISFAERVIVIHKHEYVATKTITNYETKPIYAKEIAGVKIEVKGDTIIVTSDTYSLSIKKTIMIK